MAANRALLLLSLGLVVVVSALTLSASSTEGRCEFEFCHTKECCQGLSKICCVKKGSSCRWTQDPEQAKKWAKEKEQAAKEKDKKKPDPAKKPEPEKGKCELTPIGALRAGFSTAAPAPWHTMATNRNPGSDGDGDDEMGNSSADHEFIKLHKQKLAKKFGDGGDGAGEDEDGDDDPLNVDVNAPTRNIHAHSKHKKTPSSNEVSKESAKNDAIHLKRKTTDADNEDDDAGDLVSDEILV